MAGESAHIEDVTSSKVFIIDELIKLRNIIPYTNYKSDRSSTENIKTLLDTVILPWGSFDAAHKIDNYKRHVCHELNFFLLKRDRPFFDEIALPLISGKLEKSLLDWYLLSDTMAEYREAIMKHIDDFF